MLSFDLPFARFAEDWRLVTSFQGIQHGVLFWNRIGFCRKA